jgi:hypothetical protein
MRAALPRVFQAAVCLLCGVASWNSLEDLTGTEAVGGSVTGPMIDAAAIGTILSVLAAVGSLIWPRIAAADGLVACVLCLPLYIYRILPRFFRIIFPGPYKGQPGGALIWHGWSIAGVLTSVIVVYLFYRYYLARPNPSVSKVEE